MKQILNSSMIQRLSIYKTFSFAVILAIGSFAGAALQAATMQIFFDDLDLEFAYDGATGEITTVGGADSLIEIDISIDSNPVGSITGGTIDLTIPGLPAIPVGMSSILTSAPGGTLSLDFGGGNFLNLVLEEAQIAYLHASSQIQFVGGGSVGAIGGQSLPLGLVIGDPVSLTISTNVTQLTDDGTNILTFLSNGTGELSGTVVPEPTSLGLLALGGLLGSMMVYRYRLG